MEVSDLLEAAKSGSDLPSDAKLARHLDISNSMITTWRRHINIPPNSIVMRLCEMADVPVEAGLLWRNVWAAGDEARSIYERLARDAEKRASKGRRAA